MRKEFGYLAAIALSLLLFIHLPIPSAQRNASFTWRIDVDEVGDAEVWISLRAEGEGETWILLPSRGELAVSPTPHQSSYNLTRIEWSYFYDNYSFIFREPTTIEIHYPFRYAVLIEGGEAVFLSPLIFLDEGGEGSIEVRLPNVEMFLQLVPSPSEVREEDGEEVLVYELPMESRRIWVRYRLEDAGAEEAVDVGPFTALISSQYVAPFRGLLRELEDINPALSEFFGFNLTGIEFRVYLPEDLGSAGGFVRPEEGDVIHVNLLMLRYVPGYMEIVALHELLHHYILRAGIEPELTWFHEGAATFLSIHFLKDSGLDGVERYRRRLEAEAAGFMDLKFLMGWKGGEERPGFYYAAAYRLFKELNSTLGIEFLSKFFHEVHSRGLKLRKNIEVFRIMSELSDGMSDEVLARMGITVEEIGEAEAASIRETGGREYFRVQNLKVLAVILTIILAIEMAIILLENRRTKIKREF